MEIANNLNQHKSQIIKVLTANNWRHFRDYFFIKENFLKNNLDDESQRRFCSYYVMNVHMNTPEKKVFFDLLQKKEMGLKNILKKLHTERRKLFLSFGTKLLHTINEKLPIYDRNIAYILKLSAQTYPASPEERIKNRIDIYEELKNGFKMLLANTEIKYYLKSIRRELQNKARIDKFNWQDKFISDTKLLDSLLWALYPILKNGASISVPRGVLG